MATFILNSMKMNPVFSKQSLGELRLEEAPETWNSPALHIINFILRWDMNIQNSDTIQAIS
jgi:hypothetical protein